MPITVAGIIAMTLSGCGGGGGGGPKPAPLGPTPAPPTPTTDPEATNLWQWRSDMIMGKQITYDLSQDIAQHCIYGGCWRDFHPQTLAGGNYVQYGPAADQLEENNKTYGTYDGENGVTLFNLRNDSTRPGCLMRKSRLPIDLSQISVIELDVNTSGGSGVAPWYSVWLTPMVYSDKDDNAKAAEIDLIENYDWLKRGRDMNNVQSAFAQCGVLPYTFPYCRMSNWGAVATTVNHHITLRVTNTSEGRVIRVYRCPNDGTQKTKSCGQGNWPFAEIKVDKSPPAGVAPGKWFPIWNKAIAGEHFAHYWLVADIWWTSGTDFRLTVDNVKFFKNDGTEWKMDLHGPLSTGNVSAEIDGNDQTFLV